MLLYKTLRSPSLLDTVELDGDYLRLSAMHWDDYWAEIPKAFQGDVDRLRRIWESYIDSGFASSHAAPYCEAYFILLRTLARQGKPFALSDRDFLAKTLGFENFTLKLCHSPSPFAAATASFRNPAFLSFNCMGIRKNDRNDPSLLPLIVGNSRNTPMLYYHYRKQNILKNTDESILFFPAVDFEMRLRSFQGLQIVAGTIADEWDSRIEQRAHLLADRVLVPLLKDFREARRKQTALRILDIGSGVGLFTSKVTSRIVNSGVLGAAKVEISLLDILSVDPKRHFCTPALFPGLSKVEYIRSNYATYLDSQKESFSRRFDIVFLFRMLHNMSVFRIGTTSSEEEENPVVDRYRLFPHMSNYYSAVSLLFPRIVDDNSEKDKQSLTFFPKRVFNVLSLVTSSGQSLITLLMKVSDNVLIEDGDLCADTLVKHVSRHNASEIAICDLSRSLRLSMNHIYWITVRSNGFHPRGDMIWPR